MHVVIKKRIKQFLLYGLLPLFVVLLLTLSLLLYTTAGARFVLSRASGALEGVVNISATITDGSIARGLMLDKVHVNVPDIVSVSADFLNIKSSGLYDLLALGTYYVKDLHSKNLKVELLLKDDGKEDKSEDKTDTSSDEIFILKFPVKIFIERLRVDDFAYLSDIVDVHVAMFEGKLRAFDSSAQLMEGLGDSILVHLKNDETGHDKSSYGKSENNSNDKIDDKNNAVLDTKNTDEHKSASSSNKTEESNIVADNKSSAIKDTADNITADENTQNSQSASNTKAQKSADGQIADKSDNTDKALASDKDKVQAASQDEALSLKESEDKASLKDAGDVKHSDSYRFSGRDGVIEKLYTVHLPLNAYIASLKVTNSRYYQDGYDTGLFDGELSGSFEDTLVKIRYLKLKHKLGDVNIKGSMRFENYYDLDFSVEGQGAVNDYTHDNYEGLLYGLKGSGTVTGSLSDINLKAELLNPDKTAVDIRFNALSDDLALNADVVSAAFAWPLLTDTPKARGTRLLLHTRGSLINGLDTKFGGIISGYGLKDFKVDLNSLIRIGDMDIKALNLKGLYEGSMVDATYRGHLNYSTVFGLDGTVSLNVSDGSFIDKNLKGPLSLSSNLSAYLDNNDVLNSNLDVKGLRASAHLNGVDAMLQGQNIKGSVRSGINIEELSFLQKNNAVHIKGVVGDNSELHGTVNLYNLTLLHPSLSGDAAGTLKVTGALDDLDINLNARSYRVKFDDMILDDINVNSFLKTKDMSFGLTGLISSLRPGVDLEDLKQCVLDVHGALADHSVNFICAGNNTLYLDYDGALDKDAAVYTGSIGELILNNIRGISLSLQEEIPLEYNFNKKSGEIGSFELRGNVGSLFVSDTKFGQNLFTSNIDLKELNLKYLRLFMPKSYDLKGSVNARAAIDIKDGRVKAKGFINANNSLFIAPSVFVPFEKLILDFDGSDNSIGARLEFAMRRNLGNGLVNVKVSDIKKSRKLSGSIDIDRLDLKLISQVGQIFNDIEGQVQSSGSIGGTLDKPLFYGDIKVAGKAEPRYDIGQIEDFALLLKGLGSSANIGGFINLNGEKLNIDGQLDWQDEAQGQMAFKAKNLPAFLAGYGAAIADIDIAASLTQSVDVKGSVHIPKAQLTVKGLSSSSIGVSKDEIVIGSHGTQALKPKAKAPLESAINLDVTLGDDVQLSAMGLNALVAGAVNVSKQKDSADFTGSGKISLKDGEIELYGHHFHVVKADTIFNGNITNPALDFEVIANSDELEDDVEVGIKVSGSALEPDIDLFSRPAMSENEILSYILYGHGLEKSSATQDANNGALLLGLGLSSTTSLVNSIVGVLGFQDVQVGASGSGDEAQVSVQGYLTKKIRISYGYGIYNAVGEFKVRYELVRKLYAEFVSSVDQAVDLIYSFEFN